MKNIEQKNSNSAFKQNSNVSLIFPFMTNKNNVRIIKDNMKNKGLVSDEKFITDNSRYFDYIENLFRNYETKTDELNESYNDRKLLNHQKNYAYIIEKSDSRFADFAIIETKSKTQIDKYYLLESVELIIFGTGVFFLVLKYEGKKIQKYEEYFGNFLKLKDYYKATNIIDFVAKALNLCKNEIEFFDANEADGNSKFQVFSEILLGHDDKTKHKHFKNDRLYLNEKQSLILANYFLNRNSVIEYPKYEPKNIAFSSAFYGNKVYCTDEGVLSLTIDNEINDKLIMKTYLNEGRAFIQNLFYSYIIILHQLYFLHYIQKRVKSLDVNEKNVKKQLLSIKNDYILFKTNYLYKKVSNYYYQESIYQMILSVLRIKEFCEEVDNSTKPLDEVLKEQRDDRLNKIAKIFTAITIANAFCSLLGAYYAMFSENQIKKFLIIGIVPILFLIIYLCFVFSITNNSKK